MHGNGRARLSVLPIADFDAHRQPAIAGATRVRNVMLGYALLTNNSNVEKNHIVVIPMHRQLHWYHYNPYWANTTSLPLVSLQRRPKKYLDNDQNVYASLFIHKISTCAADTNHFAQIRPRLSVIKFLVIA